LNWLIAKLKGR